MKPTGIIRRMDELGRIVIPKEMRKVLRIRDGDNLEINIDEKDNLILSKYSNINKIKDIASTFGQIMYKFLKHDVIIMDQDKIIALEGKLNEKIGNDINLECKKILTSRDLIRIDEPTKIKINNEEIEGFFIFKSIVVESEVIGKIIVYSKNQKLTEIDELIIKFVSTFFTKYLEN